MQEIEISSNWFLCPLPLLICFRFDKNNWYKQKMNAWGKKAKEVSKSMKNT